MGDIVNMSEFTPHWSGEVRCYNCGYQWEGISPVGVINCECPECGSSKGLPLHPNLPDDRPVYECNCGCWHFSVTLDGICCMNCGITTNFAGLAD